MPHINQYPYPLTIYKYRWRSVNKIRLCLKTDYEAILVSCDKSKHAISYKLICFKERLWQYMVLFIKNLNEIYNQIKFQWQG